MITDRVFYEPRENMTAEEARIQMQNERLQQLYAALLRCRELGLEDHHLETLYFETGAKV